MRAGAALVSLVAEMPHRWRGYTSAASCFHLELVPRPFTHTMMLLELRNGALGTVDASLCTGARWTNLAKGVTDANNELTCLCGIGLKRSQDNSLMLIKMSACLRRR